jgi:hypothetical protein
LTAWDRNVFNAFTAVSAKEVINETVQSSQIISKRLSLATVTKLCENKLLSLQDKLTFRLQNAASFGNLKGSDFSFAIKTEERLTASLLLACKTGRNERDQSLEVGSLGGVSLFFKLL